MQTTATAFYRFTAPDPLEVTGGGVMTTIIQDRRIEKVISRIDRILGDQDRHDARPAARADRGLSCRFGRVVDRQ